MRIALANIRFPPTPNESVRLALDAINQASRERVDIVCFPECYVPGYRAPRKNVPPPDRGFLERAWATIADAAARANIAVVLGTERIVDGTLLAGLPVVVSAPPNVDPFTSVRLPTLCTNFSSIAEPVPFVWIRKEPPSSAFWKLLTLIVNLAASNPVTATFCVAIIHV